MGGQHGAYRSSSLKTPQVDISVYSPGRFFVVNELKALMSHVLLNFDVKIDKFPTPVWIADTQLPNQSSKVSFRKRVRTP